MDGRGGNGETDGAETVLEMGKQVWDWMFVRDLDKDDLFSKSVVEWVHVDEVNGGAVVVVDFGDFEVALVRRVVPEVNNDFLLLMYRCMKASFT